MNTLAEVAPEFIAMAHRIVWASVATVDPKGRPRSRILKHAPAPVGYDPAIVPSWQDGPQSPEFGVLRLSPWRLRVFPGTVLRGRGGTVLTWAAPPPGC